MSLCLNVHQCTQVLNTSTPLPLYPQMAPHPPSSLAAPSLLIVVVGIALPYMDVLNHTVPLELTKLCPWLQWRAGFLIIIDALQKGGGSYLPKLYVSFDMVDEGRNCSGVKFCYDPSTSLRPFPSLYYTFMITLPSGSLVVMVQACIST